MAQRTFVDWAEPIAERARAARAQLVEYARGVPADGWPRPSAAAGWSRRDVLAHVAGDTGKWFSQIFSAVLDGTPLDPRRVGPAVDSDAINARDVAGRRTRSVEELIAEIEADGERYLDLLSRLGAGHRDVEVAPFGEPLARFLADNPAGDRAGHDVEHLAHIRGDAAE